MPITMIKPALLLTLAHVAYGASCARDVQLTEQCDCGSHICNPSEYEGGNHTGTGPATQCKSATNTCAAPCSQTDGQTQFSTPNFQDDCTCGTATCAGTPNGSDRYCDASTSTCGKDRVDPAGQASSSAGSSSAGSSSAGANCATGSAASSSAAGSSSSASSSVAGSSASSSAASSVGSSGRRTSGSSSRRMLLGSSSSSSSGHSSGSGSATDAEKNYCLKLEQETGTSLEWNRELCKCEPVDASSGQLGSGKKTMISIHVVVVVLILIGIVVEFFQ